MALRGAGFVAPMTGEFMNWFSKWFGSVAVVDGSEGRRATKGSNDDYRFAGRRSG